MNCVWAEAARGKYSRRVGNGIQIQMKSYSTNSKRVLIKKNICPTKLATIDFQKEQNEIVSVDFEVSTRRAWKIRFEVNSFIYNFFQNYDCRIWN